MAVMRKLQFVRGLVDLVQDLDWPYVSDIDFLHPGSSLLSFMKSHA